MEIFILPDVLQSPYAPFGVIIALIGLIATLGSALIWVISNGLNGVKCEIKGIRGEITCGFKEIRQEISILKLGLQRHEIDWEILHDKVRKMEGK
jgi:hypothetical protein